MVVRIFLAWKICRKVQNLKNKKVSLYGKIELRRFNDNIADKIRYGEEFNR